MFHIGNDVVHISSITRTYEVFGDRFAQRILHVEELEHFFRLPTIRKAPFLAKRFAAKEAVSKALRVGIGRQGLAFNNIVIYSDDLGAPCVKIDSSNFQDVYISVSISDDDDIVVSSAVACTCRSIVYQ